MKKGMIIILIVAIAGVVLTVLIAGYNKRKRIEATASSQAGMLTAQAQAQALNTQAMQDCKQNWLCSLSTVLGGVGNIAGSVSMF